MSENPEITDEIPEERVAALRAADAVTHREDHEPTAELPLDLELDLEQEGSVQSPPVWPVWTFHGMSPNGIPYERGAACRVQGLVLVLKHSAAEFPLLEELRAHGLASEWSEVEGGFPGLEHKFTDGIFRVSGEQVSIFFPDRSAEGARGFRLSSEMVKYVAAYNGRVIWHGGE